MIGIFLLAICVLANVTRGESDHLGPADFVLLMRNLHEYYTWSGLFFVLSADAEGERITS